MIATGCEALHPGYLAMRSAFEGAAAACPTQVSSFSLRFGERPARLRIVGDTLAQRIAPAFAHLGGEEVSSPGPTIDLWDRAVTGIDCPPPPREEADFQWERPEVEASVRSYGGNRFVRDSGRDRVMWLDLEAARVVGMLHSGERVRYYETARPLVRVMAELCHSLAIQLVHAGLVASGGRGALLIGTSGSGKSTTSLDCAFHGLDFLADDTVGVEPRADGSFVGHSIYGSARIAIPRLRRWPSVAEHALVHEGNGKALLWPVRIPSCRVERRARIVALVMPVVAKPPARTERISGAVAFRALTAVDLGGARGGHVSFDKAGLAGVLAMVRSVPCFRVEVGPDPAQSAAAVSALLGELS